MKYDLTTETPAYIYETMANHIAARIDSGELKPNEPLPGERRLAEDYGVSLGTARRAIETLRARGLVSTLPGMGTYVLGRTMQSQQRHRELSKKKSLLSPSKKPGG